jgi:hypothetical protein
MERVTAWFDTLDFLAPSMFSMQTEHSSTSGASRVCAGGSSNWISGSSNAFAAYLHTLVNVSLLKTVRVTPLPLSCSKSIFPLSSESMILERCPTTSVDGNRQGCVRRNF